MNLELGSTILIKKREESVDLVHVAYFTYHKGYTETKMDTFLISLTVDAK